MKSFPRFLLFLACCATRLLAASPSDFAGTRAILSDSLSAPRLVQVRLDAPLLAATQPGFADLRLFDAADRELPRAIEPLYTTQERMVRHPVASRPTGLQELPDNRIEARFELAKDAPSPAGLSIRTPLKDFIRTVRVTGSEDGQAEEVLLAESEIFDYSRYMDIRRTEISLPPNSCRHFSIEISNASEERAQPLVRLVQANGQDKSRAFDLLQTPFRIDGISFWHEAPVIDRDKLLLQEWPHAGWTIEQNPKAQTTEITLDTRKAPITRLDLETPEHNFQRTASIQIPALANGQKTWRTIATGKFTRIDLPEFATHALSIELPEQRVAQLRLVLQNNDNPPLTIADIRSFGPVYRLLWLADPGIAYRLAFGNDQLPAPAYDLFAIRTALSKGIAPDLWALAEPGEIIVPHKAFSLGEFLARPLVFGSALALSALALLLLLAKALKKVV